MTTNADTRLALGSFQAVVHSDDPLVRYHRVHGVPTLPSFAVLDAMLRGAALVGLDPAATELSQVLFESAVAMPDGAERRLAFRSHHHHDGIRLTVGVRPGAADADQDAERPCAECVIRPVPQDRPASRLDVGAIRDAIASGAGTPLEDRYATMRARGIEHRGFMCANGTVLEHDGRLVAELTLPDEARRRRDDFFWPPTFLDAAVVAAVADALGGAGDAFLPVFVGSFVAWERPGEVVYAATQPGGAIRREDALETDLSLYREDGTLIAELRRLTVMRTTGEAAARPSEPAGNHRFAPRPAEPQAGPAHPASARRRSRRLQIAVVGMSGRYPGAADLDELWENLEAGRDCIGQVPEQRWDPAEYETESRKLSRFGGFMDDVDKFDPLFFRVPPSTAAQLDPQERLFLEAAYGAIENAGYQPFGFAEPDNRVGVFVGASWTDYRLVAAEAARDRGTPTAVSGLSAIANRVSYTLNLAGPSLVVDTACSASLTALHLACRSLAEGECDAALAGGVNLLLHPEKYLIYSQMNLISSDGRLRPFGTGGDGHVPGEGVGALFLKPLDRAVADGDTVHGVILASAVNHGGQAAGFTVPRPNAQASLIRRALEESEADPASIGYIEAHGTGTALGDPIEIAGLAQAYAGRTRALAVGSIKSNIGHLEAAAGVVGVTRALLQFRHGRITPSLHSATLNPEIDFESTPFYVPQRVEPWPRQAEAGSEQPRRSAISSFGAGGANAHVVLEEYIVPPSHPGQDSGGQELMVLSARSPARLREYARRVARHLRENGEYRLADVARTLQAGRPALEARLAFVVASVPEAAAGLARFAAGDQDAVYTGTAASTADPARSTQAAQRYRAGDLDGAARLWADGASLDWAGLHGGPQRRVPLPGYPFERQAFWLGAEHVPPTAPSADGAGEGRPAATMADPDDVGTTEAVSTSRQPPLLAAASRAFEAAVQPVADALEIAFPAMGRYAASALHLRLRELGLSPGVTSRAELSRLLGVIPAYERFVDAFLAVLERHHGLHRQDDLIEIAPDTADPLSREALLVEFPETEPVIRFIDTCLKSYPQVLSGRTPATEVLFAGASMELMAGVYRGNRVYDFYSELAARLVVCAVAAASRLASRPVRVLEVGAGTGGTSHAALAALAADGFPVEYFYTDIGGSFVAHGRATFGTNYPFARFQRFDMERDPQAQGYQPGSIDVILVVGALHATADIDATLLRLRSLLAPSGILVAGEAVTDHDAMAVAAGLFAGWTLYRDSGRRIANSPLLTEENWARAFERTGFHGFTAYGPGLTGDDDCGHRVLVAARPEHDPGQEEDGPGRADHDAGRPADRVADGNDGPDIVGRTPAPQAPDPLDDDEAAELGEPLIAGIVAGRLGIPGDEIRRDRSFAEYGVDSILAVGIVNEVNERFGLEMKPTALFDYPSVRDLTDFVVSEGGRPIAAAAAPVSPPAAEPAEALAEETAGAAGSPQPAGTPESVATPETASTPESGGSLKPGNAPSWTGVTGMAAPARPDAPRTLDIAIVGIAGRYPEASDYRALWRNLAAGQDAVTEVPRTRWDVDTYYQPGPPTPGKTYSRWGAYLADVDQFDPLFFGISPSEADMMDPQQRLFLEEAWRAIEDAAIDPHALKGSRCGVFAGAPPSDYLNLIRARGMVGHYGVFTGNSPAILPSRIAYHLDLTGPSVAVDTACSSSLIAIYQACRSLAAGECDIALAGGVAVFATAEHHQLSASLGMLSPTGRCRPFDAAADGLALGEGVGVVLLKPLAAALADGDPVHGVIRGIGVNQDGRTNGITAPSARSQAALELDVYRRFGIDPATIGYVEAHGTGTRLGDPIEVVALTTAFRQYTERRQFVPIGSIKSNIGHTSHAAGVAGLLKVLMAMKTGQLPPTLHFQTPNPLIGFEDTPFFVNAELRPWTDDGPRRAAVSSFGFSGTNCHLVVDEHRDARPPATGQVPRVLVPLSAQSEDGLRHRAADLARFLADQPRTDLRDLAATLATRGTGFECRLAVIAGSADELRERLLLAADGKAGRGITRGSVQPGQTRRPPTAAPAADLETAAGSWVSGELASLRGLPAAGQGRRISLPGYTFARDRCWLPESGDQPAIEPPSDGGDKPPADDRGLMARAVAYVKEVLAAEARLPLDRLSARAPMEDYGIESVLIARLTRRLERDFGRLPSTLFFDCKTIGELGEYFAREHAGRLATMAEAPVTEAPVTEVTGPEATMTTGAPEAMPLAPTAGATSQAGSAARAVPWRSGDVAVIGMAGRFPMAATVDELWRNLLAGRDCITEVPADRWEHDAYLSDDPDEPGTTYARWGGFIDGVDCFDARFFGVSPKDAELMDPQQRLFLEASWTALEDAGYTPERARRTARRRGTKDVGVFAGVTYGEYQLLVDIPIAGYWAVANRVSYHLGFSGPSLAVDTACSSSLTAVHLACESLRRGECGYALAGGVNITIHPGKFLLLGLGRWASTDGRCRTFGAGGDGYVPGEGVAVLVLKPLEDALADGDRVYGVIKASAANQDGRTNGFTVPNPQAQAQLVQEALTRAGVAPRSVSYVEAHGTGTSLGDPIEIAALTRAFRRFTADEGFCRIGSAKSSIGHLEAAAGIAGLVKVLLQLRHDTIAPTLHAVPPNPGIDFASSPFQVALQAEPWPRAADGAPRIAAVSSFGAGGSNAHVIVADGPTLAAPAAPVTAAGPGARLIVLSARQADRLTEQIRSLAQFLRSDRGREADLADVAWTLMVGREAFEHRVAIVAADHDDLRAQLEALANGGTARHSAAGIADPHEDVGDTQEDGEYLRALVARGDLRRVGRLWAQGWAVDWESLAGTGTWLTPGKVGSLPAYPFARDRHWIVPDEYRRSAASPRPATPSRALAGSAPARDAATDAPAEDSSRDQLELRMKEIFSELSKMPAEEIDARSDFADLGFDSIVTVRMVNRLMKAYGVRIPGAAIEEHTTIRSFADYVIREGLMTGREGKRRGDPRIAAVIAAPARQADRLVLPEPLPVESIFITGVTGVLGGRLLFDLLSDTTIRVTCLVRGDDLARARDRVRYFLSVYDTEGRLEGEFERRVSVLLGDVSQDQMGLDDDTLSRLAATTDLTIHAAARTTLITFYDSLAPVNVDGTRRAIDFALRTKHKYLMYVSSFSALGDWQIYDNPPFRESDLELGQGYDHLPYQETKYHAEKLVRAATDEGLVWNIVRPGNIMGDSRTGRYPFAEVTVKGVFYDIFKTMAETGFAMLSPNHWDISPVDYVSAGLLNLALRRPSYRETYHLTNPDVRSLYDIFRHIGEFGYQLRPISVAEFHRRATERLFRKNGSDEPYESQTIEVIKYGIEIWGREHYEQSAAPNATYTASILRQAGITCPPIADLMPRYLRHCVEAGYIDSPAVGTAAAVNGASLAGRRAAVPPASPAPASPAAGGPAHARPDAVVFPGQGAQRRGMAADYHARFAIARLAFEEASDAAGADLARICFDDDPRLRRTEFTQPCLLTAEIAAYRVAAELGLAARIFGGHSVGEYTALVAAGAIPLADAVRLVRRRGALMQSAAPDEDGGMAALIHENIEKSGALAIVTALGAEIANRNSPNQVAISGTVACLDEVRHTLAEALPELDYVALKVSAPFHSRFMRTAEQEFEPYLRECAQRFQPARAAAVTSNLTGGFHDPAALTDNLLRQISSPVLWQDNMQALADRAGRIFEIGPRGSLSKFFRAAEYPVTAITTLDEALGQLDAASVPSV